MFSSGNHVVEHRRKMVSATSLAGISVFMAFGDAVLFAVMTQSFPGVGVAWEMCGPSRAGATPCGSGSH